MKKQKKTDTVIFFFVPIAILLLWQILGDGGAGRGIPRLEMPAPAGEGGEQCESSVTRSA